MSSSPEFDGAAERASASSAPTPATASVVQSILRASSQAGIDPVAELYNEALTLAKEGHYGLARDRLQVLLGLAPSDGDAHLLLAKVFVAGQQWRRAIASLDEAAQCGTHVSEDLRDAVVRHLQDEVSHGEQQNVRADREQGEIKKLRSTARRLRSDNAHFQARVQALETEASRWAWIASGTSTIAILLLLANMFLGGLQTTTTDEAGDEAVVEATPEAAALPETVDDVIIRNPDLADVALAALEPKGLAAGLQVVVRGTEAHLSGTVPSAEGMKTAIDTLMAIQGIDKVRADAVTNLAFRNGTTYTVRPGDSLSLIAFRMYGIEPLHKHILEANPQLGGRPNLKVGQALTIPPAPREE